MNVSNISKQIAVLLAGGSASGEACERQAATGHKMFWHMLPVSKLKNVITLSGSITVEMSYILPVIILLFVLTINTVFYFHDKNILIGGAAETAVLGAQMERQQGEKADLQRFFTERISGKLILLRLTGIEIKSEKKWFKVTVCAQKGKMQLCAEQKAAIAKPEKKIREKRKLESLLDWEEKITNENGL